MLGKQQLFADYFDAGAESFVVVPTDLEIHEDEAFYLVGENTN